VSGEFDTGLGGAIIFMKIRTSKHTIKLIEVLTSSIYGRRSLASNQKKSMKYSSTIELDPSTVVRNVTTMLLKGSVSRRGRGAMLRERGIVCDKDVTK